jgi:hypothetical protein
MRSIKFPEVTRLLKIYIYYFLIKSKINKFKKNNSYI